MINVFLQPTSVLILRDLVRNELARVLASTPEKEHFTETVYTMHLNDLSKIEACLHEAIPKQVTLRGAQVDVTVMKSGSLHRTPTTVEPLLGPGDESDYDLEDNGADRVAIIENTIDQDAVQFGYPSYKGQ